MGEMTDLIERLEKATGPDVDLDEAIACFLAPPHPRHGKPVGMIYAPKYTASIDAALTLVPKDLAWRVDVMTGLPGAIVCVPNAWVSHKTAPTHWAGTTPAIALCIAALKARASVKAGYGGEVK
jgi:hypothetical protein